MRLALLVMLVTGGAGAEPPAEPPMVAAASSLTDVVDRIATQYATATSAERPRLAFGGSSRIARQIMEGSPADVVITANPSWMDTLDREGLIDSTSRHDLLRNRLVGVCPAEAECPAQLKGIVDVDRIAIGGGGVPAGLYAREALTHAGILEEVAPKLIEATNVRATLALASRGEVDVALVYETDAVADPAVQIGFRVGSAAHSPILYPAALTSRGAANPAARAFFDYLHGDAARRVFEDAGFGVARAVGEPVAAVQVSPPLPPADVAILGPLLRSMFVAVMALGVSVLPALVLGTALARGRFRGKSLLSMVLMAPLVLPPVVTGYGLLKLFGRNGPFAFILSPLGLDVAFTRWGAVVAAAVVGFPLLILMVRSAIEGVDARYEQVARTLGRSPLAAFVQVTLPMAAPGLVAGCVLAFARALGEFGATAVLAGDIPGETRTLALAVYALYEQPGGESTAVWLSAISLVLCLVALLGYERLVRAQRTRLEDR